MRIIHDDPGISETLIPYIPVIGCLVGDFLEYKTFLDPESLARWLELEAENAVCEIMERENVLKPEGQELILYVTTKPAF